MADEKRVSRRLSKSIEVDCRTLDAEGLSVPVRISDLSCNGAFLDSMNPLPVGTRLGLRFAIGERLFVLSAQVVHAMPQFGMGVRFLDLTPDVRAVLSGTILAEA